MTLTWKTDSASILRPRWRIVAVVLLAASSVFLGGCTDQTAPPPAPGAGTRVETCYDFLLHVDEARFRHEPSTDPTVEDDRSIPRIRSINGQMRYSIMAHPPSEITYRLDIHPGARLSFAMALAPRAHQLSVDGVEFVVYVREHLFKKKVFSQHLAPHDGTEQNRWVAVEVDLGRFAGKSVEITLATGPGPQGNHDHDIAYWGEPRLLSRGRVAPRTEPEAVPVFLVSLDTVRMDHLDLSGHHRCTAPHLNRLLGEMVLFTGARAPSHWTMPSHMSVFTSLTPDIHQVVDPLGGRQLAGTVPTLTERLRDTGYHTVGFSTSDFLQGRLGFDRGFNHYELRQWNTADQQNRLLFDWIETHQDKRLFVFMHYMDAHSDWQELPYEALDGFDALFSDLDPTGSFTGCSADRSICASDYLKHLNQTAEQLTADQCRTLRGQYDRGLRYLDYHLARFVAGLKVRGIWDRGLVIFFSDHGEEFQDHGMYLHSQLYEELLLVPLLVKLPGGRFGGTRVDTPVALIDLAPTILSQLDIPVPRTMQGHDLTRLIELSAENAAARPGEAMGRAGLFSWTSGACSIQQERWKMIFEAVGGTLRPQRLFDLEKDPGEQVNLLADEPEIGRQFERALQSRLAEHQTLTERLGAALADAPQSVFSAEEQERLELLGYLQ